MTETDIFKAQNSFAPEFIRGVFDNHTSFEKKHILSPARFEQHNIVSRYCPILVSNFGPLFYMFIKSLPKSLVVAREIYSVRID